MAKIRKIKDPIQKRAIKKVAAKRKAEKRALKEPKIHVHVHIHIHVHVNRKSKQKKHPVRKGDKQRAFFNKGQKGFLKRIAGFLQELGGNENKFISFLKQIPKEDIFEVNMIKNESAFMKFHKHIPKRKEVKYNSILALISGNVYVVRSYRTLQRMKQKSGRLVSLFPVNNQRLHQFIEMKAVS